MLLCALLVNGNLIHTKFYFYGIFVVAICVYLIRNQKILQNTKQNNTIPKNIFSTILPKYNRIKNLAKTTNKEEQMNKLNLIFVVVVFDELFL